MANKGKIVYEYKACPECGAPDPQSLSGDYLCQKCWAVFHKPAIKRQ